jgi:hypothetical protein
MNMYWVYDLPNWLFGTLTISAFLAPQRLRGRRC